MANLPEQVVTPRLVLRRWQPEDVPAIGRAVRASLEHLRPWMAWTADEPLSDHDRLQLVASWREGAEDGGDAVYGALCDGTIVGACGLHRRAGPEVLEIGYWIHVDHLRQGYATELARGLTTAAFVLDDIDRVEIHHDKANLWSGAVPRSLGYEPGPERPDAPEAPAEIGIDCTWSITRSQWRAGTAAEHR